MTDAKNDLGMNLETTLESLRTYLRSEISELKQDPASSYDIPGKTKNLDLVNIKVKVRNSAPPRGGFGEVVFVGVGLTIACNANDHIFNKLKNTVKKQTVQQWQQNPPKSVIWYVNTWVEEEDGYSTHRAQQINGDTLFPGEAKEYEIAVPSESLPYISITVDGYISPGNLFRSRHILPGFEQWSKPELTASIKDLVGLNTLRPVKRVTAGIPEFGPGTTFEAITAFRNTLTESKTEISNIKVATEKTFKNHYNLEILHLIGQIIFPYLNSFEKSCDNVFTALASGDMDKITESIKELKLNSDKAKEIEEKIRNLELKSGIELRETGSN